MNNRRNEAIEWINKQDTKHSRVLREKAKYLVGKLTAYETPHPAVWNEVLKISEGM